MGDIERTDLDKLLLANANKSLEEISALTGLSPEDAATRLSQLYEDRGVLTDLYRERQLIEDLYDIYEEVKQKAASAAERNSAGLYNALRQIITLMFDRLEKARNKNERDLTTVNEFHARIMVGAISLAFEKALFELQKRYPEVDREELQTIMEDALPLALESIDRANDQ